ncbi:MAG: flagellar biosynthesis anti-sigma factor FlgM [Desulfobacter sp.]|nr:flagellar biosynthesis anti-sigma factor FlgM [Desulfobacter sp.]WDP87104.1 MAG: flagellar biosynthesis anti-sigma factor FlgM [Desulfobacter sp.]
MKITNSNYISQNYTNSLKQEGKESLERPSGQPEHSSGVDKINLSSTTRELQKISLAAETEPENREKLVEDLKQQVQSNQYAVNAEQVAEKMIGSIMDELG